MKKKIGIGIGIFVIIIIIAGIITNYVDSGRVGTGHEPKYCIKIDSNDGSKITYWGLGYKVVRYVGVSPNEPYESNIGVKMGNWFMKYELPKADIIEIEYEGQTITVTDIKDIGIIENILLNSKYDGEICNGINTHKITLNNEVYYIKESCKEIQKGEKQSKITEEDLNTITNIFEKNINQNYQKYSTVIDNIKLELNIPSEWKYEEMPKDEQNDFYKYALKFYKNNEEQYAVLYFYNNQFGVCGTGRTAENITLNNGKQATIGYYDGNKKWSDISFYNINKNIAVLNHDLIDDESDEVIEFIKTINITENKDNEINNKVTTISIQETGLSSVVPAKEYILNQEEIYTIFSIIDNLTFSNETCDGLPTYFIRYNSQEKEGFMTYGIEMFESAYHITSNSKGEAILSTEQKEEIDKIIKRIDN